MTRTALTGNDAVAEALRQVNPDVAAVYPITPQTEMMHRFAEFVADGLVETEFVTVESEHSALSATIGASAAGSRAVTATSSQGLALMWEMLHIASGLRLPIVMPVVNRALSAPINIHCDHSDTMYSRDSGWIQIFSENSQEAYDNTIQAFRIAEHMSVRLPVMVTLDGFIISHTMETVDLLEDDEVRKFVGDFEAEYSLLDVDHPITVGSLFLPDYYFEAKRQEHEALINSFAVIEEVGKLYGELSGRKSGFFEAYRLDDAQLALVVMGSAAGTATEVVDELRGEGKPVGLLKIRLYRPFPTASITKVLARIPVVGVLDRAIAFGLEGGPVYHDVRSALYGQTTILQSFIAGLGGRDITPGHIRTMFDILADAKKRGKADDKTRFIGVRE